MHNSCKPLHLFLPSLKISPTTPFLYVSIWMQHCDKELYLQSGAGHQRVSAYTAKTRRTMKSSYFSYWALSFKIIRISENKLKLQKMNTIQVTYPLNIFPLGWINEKSCSSISNILALLLKSLLCSVMFDPQHENKFIAGSVLASSTEMIDKHTHHLDALAQNIRGTQCWHETLISLSEGTAGNNHSKSDGYK